MTEPPPVPREFRLGYRKSLDGVRGIAVSAVLAGHAGVHGFHAGFVGVEVFFVLSGFLITSILLDEWRASGRISLKAFYARRALRLVPALVVFLLFWATIDALVLGHGWSKALHAIVAPLLYVTDGYIQLGYPWLPLYSHTWSLGVEEQFYLLWPPILALALRWVRTPARLLPALVALIVVILTGRTLALPLGGWGPWIFGTYFVRFDGLLLGCAISILVETQHSWVVKWRVALSALRWIVTAIAIEVSYFMAPDWDPICRAGLFLFGLASALWIVELVTTERSLKHVALEVAPLVWVGQLSYSLYLWHYPFLTVTPKGLALIQNYQTLWLLCAGLPAACISHYGVEKPFLRLKARFTRVESRGERTEPGSKFWLSWGTAATLSLWTLAVFLRTNLWAVCLAALPPRSGNLLALAIETGIATLLAFTAKTPRHVLGLGLVFLVLCSSTWTELGFVVFALVLGGCLSRLTTPRAKGTLESAWPVK